VVLIDTSTRMCLWSGNRRKYDDVLVVLDRHECRDVLVVCSRHKYDDVLMVLDRHECNDG